MAEVWNSPVLCHCPEKLPEMFSIVEADLGEILGIKS
jgi:hypothetical protein